MKIFSNNKTKQNIFHKVQHKVMVLSTFFTSLHTFWFNPVLVAEIPLLPVKAPRQGSLIPAFSFALTASSFTFLRILGQRRNVWVAAVVGGVVYINLATKGLVFIATVFIHTGRCGHGCGRGRGSCGRSRSWSRSCRCACTTSITSQSTTF